MNSYASLSDIKTYFSFEGDEAPELNETLRNYLVRASRAIDRYTRKRFYPQKRTLYFDHPQDSRTLHLRTFFLELLGLSGQNGDQGIDLGVVFTRCGQDWNITPHNVIELDDTSGSLLNWSGTPRKSVKAVVLEGFREDYDQPNTAWVDSGTSLLQDTAASDTQLITGSSAAMATDGKMPRFKSEQIWRLGSGASAEMCYVTHTGFGASPANTTVVLRGINGTTAASHASGTKVYLWNLSLKYG
jgi:hypothetical protein